MTPTARAALLLIGALTLFRVVYGAQLGLAWDECYYWQWSRHLDLSYYDQGPGIAYCIRLGTLLFGDSLLGVRFATILFAATTPWLLFLTVRTWLGERVAWWTLLLVSFSPLYAAGGVLATYDGPLVFFWTAALWALTKALHTEKPELWYAVGALVGLGIASKVTMLLFAPGVLLLLALVPNYRRWLTTPHPYLAFAVALIGFLPILLWNQQHDSLFFKHSATLSQRHTDAAFGRWFGDFLAGQALFVGPVAWLAELWALARAKKECAEPKSRAFVLAFTLPLLAICLWTSLRSKLEINWPTTMHLTGLVALAVVFDRLWREGKRLLPLAAGILNVALILLAFFPGAPAHLGLTLPTKTFIKLSEPYGWEELMAKTEAAGKTLEAEGRTVVYAGANYRVCSALAFYLPGKPETYGLYFNSRRDQYFVWTDPKTLVGKSIVLVGDTDGLELALAQRYFGSVEPLPALSLRRPGYDEPVKQWYIYLCRDFKGYDQNAHVNGY